MFYKITEKKILLFVKVIANSKRNEIAGVFGDFLKIKISVKAEKGKANKELVGFITEKFNIAKSAVIIIKGEFSGKKIIMLAQNEEDFLGVLDSMGIFTGKQQKFPNI